ncbi:DedA family protein, partial [Bacillus licheniformis]
MGSIVNDILMWLTDLGYFGIAIGLMIEIIPSEIVLAYGGYMVSNGSITITGAVIAGVIGGTIAQLFLYWIGY